MANVTQFSKLFPLSGITRKRNTWLFPYSLSPLGAGVPKLSYFTAFIHHLSSVKKKLT